ncbi:hypothetical protein BOX15_Mlig011073g1, partial [Macrostomum lignano]
PAMSVPFSSTKLRVPRGFQSLLEGLAREVLRSQPADIYTFGAMYFEELIRRREETGDDDPAQLAAKVEDRFYNNTSFQQPTIDPSDPQQQDASKVIQTNFRRHAAQKEAAKLREDKAASEIQSAVRGHQEREAIKQSAPEQGSAEEVDIDLNDPEVEAAAAKIQAGFKGYKTRKDLLEKKNQPASAAADAEEEDSKIIEGPSKDELEEAAVKIQAGYKGYRTRKDMKAKREEAAPDAGEEAEKPQQQDEAQEQAAEEPQQENPEEEIDLNDPELAQAAIKIQAGFKGYQTRKKLKDETGQEQQDEAAEQKEAEEEKPVAAEEEEKTDEAKGEADSDAANAVDPNDPAQNQAASKIQAGFRGMQARKEVAEMRKSGQEQGEAKSAEGESEEPAEGKSEEPAEPAAVENEAEPEAKAEPEPEAEADEAKPETEADEPQPEAEPEAESKPEAEPEAEPESEDKPEAEAEAEPEAPEAAESAAAAAAPGEEENETAAPAAADDAAGAEGDEPRDE